MYKNRGDEKQNYKVLVVVFSVKKLLMIFFFFLNGGDAPHLRPLTIMYICTFSSSRHAI